LQVAFAYAHFLFALTLFTVDPATYVGTVYGSVVDESGAPIADALVTVEGAGSARTQADGSFRINSIPTPFDGGDYTISVTQEGFATSTIATVRILPGAAMALETTFVMGNAQSSTRYRYRHESEVRGPRPEASVENYKRTVFATCEGLVAGTTATVTSSYRTIIIIALPSRWGLSTNFGHEHEVRVTYHGRTVVAPVWDIGPWNTHDD